MGEEESELRNQCIGKSILMDSEITKNFDRNSVGENA